MRLRYAVWICLLLIGAACDKQQDLLTVEEQLALDVSIIDQYLSDNGITAIQHPSGLRYEILAAGQGDKAKTSQCVRVNYEAWVLGEEVPFDSRSEFGTPLSTRILGWQIGLKEIAKGGLIVLYIPSKLGYGPYDTKVTDSYTLPRNSVLKFEVELVNLTEYNSAGQYCYPWP